MENKKLEIVISAPSGAGKTTIIKKIISDEDIYRFSVSTTTRPPREGEVEGQSYFFVSGTEFRKMIEKEQFVEWALVHGNYYGTSKKEIDRIRSKGNIPIFDVDVQGSKALKKTLENAVFIFIVPPSIAELENRLRKRNTDTDDTIKIRLENAIGELREFQLFDYIVVNDEVEKAVDRIKAIVTAEICRTERNESLISKILEEKS